MEGRIFEGQYDHVLEDDYHELLDEISDQLNFHYAEKDGHFFDDTQVKFRIKVEVIND